MSSGQTSFATHKKAILTAAVISALATVVPFAAFVMLPLEYLNTAIHELCHALVAVATGGHVAFIKIFANGSGVTYSGGGLNLLISSAGYIGAAVVGAAMIYFGRSEKGASVALRLLAVLLAIGLLVWLRGDVIGFAATSFWVITLGIIAFRVRGAVPLYCCLFIGIQQCLHAMKAVTELFQITVSNGGPSDAANMQALTMIPAPFWAVLWCVVNGVIVIWTVRRSWTERPKA